MKKALTLLLTAAMLLTMLSVLTVAPVSAEETAAPARTPLKVTFQSASENYCMCDSCKTITTPVDWSYAFDLTNNTRKFIRDNEDMWIIGKFEQPTAITSFVIDNNFYPSRMNGWNIQFSTDGQNWTVGYTLQEDNTQFGTGRRLIEIPTPYDNTQYSYVRLFMSKSMNSNYVEADFYWVAFYNEADKADQLIEASLHKVTSVDGFANAEKFFDFRNTQLLKTGGTTNPDNIVEGKLSRPTVLSDIYVKFNGARMNGTLIKASVDGVNWTTITSIGGIWANCNNNAANKIAHFHVTDTTAYNYIQIVRNHALWGGHWEAYSIGFIGEEQNVSNNIKYQTKVDADAWSLRLISTIDTLDCDAVGFEITADAAELTAPKSWDRNTEIVYTSIYETVNGNEEIRDAAYCGGNYIYTAVISDISIADYSQITFTVKPYVLVDGAKVYGTTQTLVFNDGVAA